MDCSSTADLIARSLSGNASLEDGVELREHLEVCRACAEVEKRLSRTWTLMGQLQPLAANSRIPEVQAPRRLLRSPLWIVGAAAAAVLVVSTLALSLLNSRTPAPTPAPVAAQSTPEESHPDQRDEEVRVQEVLTRIENEKPAPPPPVIEKPAPAVADSKTPAPVHPPAPKPQDAPAPERKEVVKTPVPGTRPEDKPAPEAKPAPPAEEVPVIATLDRVEGQVFATIGGSRLAAASGLKLVSGCAIETSGKGSQAVVEFADGTRLVLGADTAIDSIRVSEGKRIALKQGVLAAQVSKQPAGEPLMFVTAMAEAKVLGTRLTLTATATTTGLSVREGKVRVTRKEDGAWVDVTADRSVQVGKSGALTLKAVAAAKIALRETFDRPRWGATWIQGGEANLGIRMAVENGSLSLKAVQKPVTDVGTAKMPNDAAEAARKALQGVNSVSGLSKKDWPRAAWLESRPAFPFSNEAPVRIRTRVWNSHNDPDRISWIALNRGAAGQSLSLERRGGMLQLWVEGAASPVWKKEIPAVQEWETLELWLSKDQVVVRRNEETIYVGANPLKIKAATLSVGVNAKMELTEDQEARFDDIDVILAPRSEFEEVAR